LPSGPHCIPRYPCWHGPASQFFVWGLSFGYTALCLGRVGHLYLQNSPDVLLWQSLISWVGCFQGMSFTVASISLQWDSIPSALPGTMHCMWLPSLPCLTSPFLYQFPQLTSQMPPWPWFFAVRTCLGWRQTKAVPLLLVLGIYCSP
jgi:hypothetical protein